MRDVEISSCKFRILASIIGKLILSLVERDGSIALDFVDLPLISSASNASIVNH